MWIYAIMLKKYSKLYIYKLKKNVNIVLLIIFANFLHNLIKKIRKYHFSNIPNLKIYVLY